MLHCEKKKMKFKVSTLFPRFIRGLQPAKSLNHDSINALDFGVTLWKFSLGFISCLFFPVSGKVFISCFLVSTPLIKFWTYNWKPKIIINSFKGNIINNYLITLAKEKLWVFAEPYSSAWFKLGVWEKPCFTFTGVNSSCKTNINFSLYIHTYKFFLYYQYFQLLRQMKDKPYNFHVTLNTLFNQLF